MRVRPKSKLWFARSGKKWGLISAICLPNLSEIHFVEIGADKDHIHFLIQTIPTMSPSRLAQLIKSLTAHELKNRMPEIKDQLWGASVWSSGYFINTVGRNGSEHVISRYVRHQGSKQDTYTSIHSDQLKLF